MFADPGMVLVLGLAAFSSPAGSPTLQGAPTSAAVPWHPDGVPVCVTPEPPLPEDTQRPSRAAKPAEASTVRRRLSFARSPSPPTEKRSSPKTVPRPGGWSSSWRARIQPS